MLVDRRICLVRELTKIHEEVLPTTLAEAVARYQEEPPRGEFVLILEGARPREKEAVSPEEAAGIAEGLMREGLSASEAAKQAAAQTGIKKGEIYRLLTRKEGLSE